MSSRWLRVLAAVLVPLVVCVHLQRGAAEAHHNFDAPLTIEAPFQLLPCDLALSACPAVLEDSFERWVASVLLPARTPRGLLGRESPSARAAAPIAADSPRAPPAL